MRSPSTKLVVPLLLVFVLLFRALSGQNLDDPLLDPHERRKAVRDQERRWNLVEDEPWIVGTDLGARPFADAESFPINVRQVTNLVLRSGTRLTIPSDAVILPAGSGGDGVTVEVVELREPRDFMFAGVSTAITENGKDAILESAGMIRLRLLLNATELAMRTTKKIRWQTTPAAYGDFNVYKRGQTGNWENRGKADRREPVQNRECPTCPTTSTLVFDKISGNGWWNFDKPAPDFTCVRGTVKNAEKGTMVRVSGVDRNWISYGPVSSGVFQVNVMRGERAKAVAVYEKGTIAKLASLPRIRTSETAAHTSTTNEGTACGEIGSMGLASVDPGVLADKEKFLKAIDWEK